MTTLRGDTDRGSARLVIDGDKCVHSLCAAASCRACADACPRGALHLDDASLGIDEDACDGCGLCRPACPESAIELAGVRCDALLDQDDEIALLACAPSGVPAGRGVVPCLHAVAERDLATVLMRKIPHLVTARGDCAECPRNTSATIERTVETLNALAQAPHRMLIKINSVTPAEWHKKRSRALRAGNDVDTRRRAMFGGLLRGRAAGAPAAQPLALFRFVPNIDPQACMGCDACSRVCPHGAIQFISNASETCYAFDPEDCTGCRLCVDVCGVSAVDVRALAPLSVPKIALSVDRCSKCGVPFHMPQNVSDKPAGDTPGVCQICRRSNHARQLFQVRS